MRLPIAVYLMCLILQACDAGYGSFGNKSSGSGGGDGTKKDPPITKIPGGDPYKIPDPVDPSSGKLKFSFEAGNSDVIKGSENKKPLGIYFVLDVTESMKPVLDSVKDNIKKFSDQLVAKSIDVQLGAIVFRDSIFGQFAMSKDIEAFKAFVASQEARYGGDPWEDALGATKLAIQKINAEETRANAVRAILTITDNPGHSGAPTTTDCTIDSTVQAFNALAGDQRNSLRLFYSTSPTGSACSGFASAKAQFDSIINQIFTERAAADRGTSLSWPFTGDTLTTELGSKLQEIVADKNLFCYAKNAVLTIDGKEYGTWKETSPAETIAKAQKGELLYIESTQVDPKAVSGKKGIVNISRCCVNPDDVKNGAVPASCASTKEQKVDFDIK